MTMNRISERLNPFMFRFFILIAVIFIMILLTTDFFSKRQLDFNELVFYSKNEFIPDSKDFKDLSEYLEMIDSNYKFVKIQYSNDGFLYWNIETNDYITENQFIKNSSAFSINSFSELFYKIYDTSTYVKIYFGEFVVFQEQSKIKGKDGSSITFIHLFDNDMSKLASVYNLEIYRDNDLPSESCNWMYQINDKWIMLNKCEK